MVGKIAVLVVVVVGLIAAVVGCTSSGGISFEECHEIYGTVWNLGSPWHEDHMAGMSDRCKVAFEDEALRRMDAGTFERPFSGFLMNHGGNRWTWA